MGFGSFPSWTTLFLWFKMVHSVVKMACIYSTKTISFKLCETSNFPNQCCTEILVKSVICTARGEPCQQALAKGHSRNRWELDSSYMLHKGQILLVVIPLFFRRSIVGKLSCISFHTKLQIFRGVFIIHMRFQTPFPL